MMVTFSFGYVNRTLRIPGHSYFGTALRSDVLWAITIVWPDSFSCCFPQQFAVRLFLYVTHLNCD